MNAHVISKNQKQNSKNAREINHSGVFFCVYFQRSPQLLFALGFATGTVTLHLFGVGVGQFTIKSKLSSILLRLTSLLFALYGIYLIIEFKFSINY